MNRLKVVKKSERRSINLSFTRSSGTRLANLFKSFTEVEKKLPAQLCQLVKGLKGRVPGAYVRAYAY